MKELFCKNCGGILNILGDGHYKCANCGSLFAEQSVKRQKDLLDSFLNMQKQEQLNALRRNLWQETNAEFINSNNVLAICLSIKNIYPNDFLASFYQAVLGENLTYAVDFIDKINVKEQVESIDVMVEFLIKCLKPNFLLAVNNLIERAYKKDNLQKFDYFSTKFANMAQKVEQGVYELNIPRDIFIAYSSADMEKVSEIVNFLEEQGLSCFVAMRNLQHGAGAVNDYYKALESAVDNCKIFLFLSSKNSRSLKCDAIKHEIPYLKNSDLLKLSFKFPNVPYAKIDNKYKKPRIQFRLDDEKTEIADKIIEEVFAGLEYCYNLQSLANRIAKYLTDGDPYEVDMAGDNSFKPKVEREKEQTKDSEKNQTELFDVYFSSYSHDVYGACQIVSEIAKIPFNEANAIVLSGGLIKGAVSKSEAEKIENRLKSFGATVKIISQKQGIFNKDSEESNLFRIENGVLVEYFGNEQEIKIPSSVTEIGKNSFGFCKNSLKITSVLLPEGVEKIAGGAFSKLKNLININFPKTLKQIGKDAFQGCYSLKNVNLLGVEVVGEGAFAGCKSLISVVFGENVKEIGARAFYDCENISTLYLPESVKNIGENAFVGCSSVTKLTFNEGLQTIGSYAFSGCDLLNEVHLPESVSSVGQFAFNTTVYLKSLKQCKNWHKHWNSKTVKVEQKNERKGLFKLFKKDK